MALTIAGVIEKIDAAVQQPTFDRIRQLPELMLGVDMYDTGDDLGTEPAETCRFKLAGLLTALRVKMSPRTFLEFLMQPGWYVMAGDFFAGDAPIALGALVGADATEKVRLAESALTIASSESSMIPATQDMISFVFCRTARDLLERVNVRANKRAHALRRVMLLGLRQVTEDPGGIPKKDELCLQEFRQSAELLLELIDAE